MPYANPGYDIIVKGGHKIDSKLRTLMEDLEYHFYGWKYKIDYNNIADYFLLIALDTDCKKILHIWLIHKNKL